MPLVPAFGWQRLSVFEANLVIVSSRPDRAT